MVTPVSSDKYIGEQVAGQFHIRQRIGAGGMGSVYVAEQLDEGFRRARLGPEHAQDEINVLSGELNPAVGPDDHHTTSA